MIGTAVAAGVVGLTLLLWVLTRVWRLHHVVVPQRVVPRSGAFAALATDETRTSLERASDESVQLGLDDEGIHSVDASAISAGLGLAAAPVTGWIAPINEHILALFKQGVHAQLQMLSNLSVAVEVTHVDAITTHLGTKLISDAYCVGAAMRRAATPHAAHQATHLSLFCGHAHVVSCMGTPQPVTAAFVGLHSFSVSSPVTGSLFETVNAHLGALHHTGGLAAGAAGVLHEHSSLGVHIVAHAHSGLGAGSSVATQMAAPVGALLISSFHEGRLLLNHDTDLARASKNVSLDVGGVFAGGKGGMVAGAAAGSLVGPHGTAIGGLVGGVAGVVGGKIAAGKIKRHPYEVAKRDFVRTRERFEVEEKQAVVEATAAWERKRIECEQSLRARMATLENEVASLQARMDDELRASTSLAVETAEALVREAEAVLIELVEQAESRLRARTRGLRKLAPALAAPEEYRQLEQLQFDAAEWDDQVKAVMERAAGHEAQSERLLDLVLAVPGRETAVRDHVRAINVARMRVLTTLEVAYARFTDEGLKQRGEAATILARESATLKRRLHERLTPFYEAIETAAGPFREEMRKLGQAVPKPS